MYLWWLNQINIIFYNNKTCWKEPFCIVSTFTFKTHSTFCSRIPSATYMTFWMQVCYLEWSIFRPFSFCLSLVFPPLRVKIHPPTQLRKTPTCQLLHQQHHVRIVPPHPAKTNCSAPSPPSGPAPMACLATSISLTHLLDYGRVKRADANGDDISSLSLLWSSRALEADGRCTNRR